MPYVPRPSTELACAHCGTFFLQQHRRRKYCCNSCNVLASYQRTGRRGSAQPTKAELALVLTQVLALVQEPPGGRETAAAELTAQDFAQAQRVRIHLLKAQLAAQAQAVRIAALRTARAAAPPALVAPAPPTASPGAGAPGAGRVKPPGTPG